MQVYATKLETNVCDLEHIFNKKYDHLQSEPTRGLFSRYIGSGEPRRSLWISEDHRCFIFIVLFFVFVSSTIVSLFRKIISTIHLNFWIPVFDHHSHLHITRKAIISLYITYIYYPLKELDLFYFERFDLIWFFVFNATFSYIMATSFSGGRSRSTRKEPPTMDKQLVNFITCGCESSTPFVIYTLQWRSYAEARKHMLPHQIDPKKQKEKREREDANR